MTLRAEIAAAAALAYVAVGVATSPLPHGRIIVESARIGVHSTATQSGARDVATPGLPASPHYEEDQQ
jgi:hypothetical protein